MPIIDRKFTFQLNALYFGGSWEKFNAVSFQADRVNALSLVVSQTVFLPVGMQASLDSNRFEDAAGDYRSRLIQAIKAHVFRLIIF